MTPDVQLDDWDYCLAHKRQCRRIPDATSSSKDFLDLLTAGSPCPDHSSFGKRNGVTGESGPAFMVLTLGFASHAFDLQLRMGQPLRIHCHVADMLC